MSLVSHAQNYVPGIVVAHYLCLCRSLPLTRHEQMNAPSATVVSGGQESSVLQASWKKSC